MRVLRLSSSSFLLNTGGTPIPPAFALRACAAQYAIIYGFNQFNAALHDDRSLWVVPGSHVREDTPEEVAAMGPIPASPPELTDELTAEVREATVCAYAHRTP